MTSADVRARLRLSLSQLRWLLYTHTELRPKRMEGRSYLWTPADVRRLKAHLQRRKTT